jgi:hypothetical protein
MITLAYLHFARHIWTDGRFAATVNFGLLAIGIDFYIVGSLP